MKIYFFRRYLVILSVFLLAWLLTGCEIEPERTRKPSQDWSRGLPLGTDVLGAAGMAVDLDGEGVHVVWPLWSESKGIGFHLDSDVSEDKGKVLAQGREGVKMEFGSNKKLAGSIFSYA